MGRSRLKKRSLISTGPTWLNIGLKHSFLIYSRIDSFFVFCAAVLASLRKWVTLPWLQVKSTVAQRTWTCIASLKHKQKDDCETMYKNKMEKSTEQSAEIHRHLFINSMHTWTSLHSKLWIITSQQTVSCLPVAAFLKLQWSLRWTFSFFFFFPPEQHFHSDSLMYSFIIFF